MNNSVVFNILIVSFHLSIFVSLTTSLGPGISGCIYLGETEADGKKCRKDAVKVEKLPPECSSFIYDATQYNFLNFNESGPLNIINSLLEPQKPVYIYISFGNSSDWKSVLFDSNVFSLAVVRIVDFAAKFNVRGIILAKIDEPYSKIKDDFYLAFYIFIKNIRQNTVNLEVGMLLSARTFIEKGNVTNINSTGVPWFDFSKMNDCVDFYVIEFSSFNECPIDEMYSGITPMESSNSEVMTLKKYEVALKNSTIAMQKILFEFSISPTLSKPVLNIFPPCERSYNEFCENKNNLKTSWCHDNSEILYAKGAYSKKYAQGFLGRHIDLVDRDDKCNCGKYVTFIMMVNGFNTMKDPRNCPSFL